MNRWCRARVDQLLEGDDVLLFFVDYGDNSSVNIDDTAPITEMQIKKLPFQVSTDFQLNIYSHKCTVYNHWVSAHFLKFCDLSTHDSEIEVIQNHIMLFYAQYK